MEILKSGMRDGSFRPDVDADATARALVAQFIGIVYQAQFLRARFLGPWRLDTLIAEILAQVERWLACSESQAAETKAV